MSEKVKEEPISNITFANDGVDTFFLYSPESIFINKKTWTDNSSLPVSQSQYEGSDIRAEYYDNSIDDNDAG